MEHLGTTSPSFPGDAFQTREQMHGDQVAGNWKMLQCPRIPRSIGARSKNRVNGVNMRANASELDWVLSFNCIWSSTGVSHGQGKGVWRLKSTFFSVLSKLAFKLSALGSKRKALGLCGCVSRVWSWLSLPADSMLHPRSHLSFAIDLQYY